MFLFVHDLFKKKEENLSKFQSLTVPSKPVLIKLTDLGSNVSVDSG